MPSLNWNTIIRLYPTEDGWILWEEKFAEAGLSIGVIPERKASLDLPLWQAAHVFGPIFHPGCSLPFKTVEIEEIT
jgi:hypothetical protein